MPTEETEIMQTEETVSYVNIAPDPEGVRAYLRAIANDRRDENVVRGLMLAQACGWADWYADLVIEARTR
jgi:hypothetical protein